MSVCRLEVLESDAQERCREHDLGNSSSSEGEERRLEQVSHSFCWLPAGAGDIGVRVTLLVDAMISRANYCLVDAFKT